MFCQLGHPQRPSIIAADVHAALNRAGKQVRNDTGKGVAECGFAGVVGTGQHHEFSVAYAQTDIAQGRCCGSGIGEAEGVDHHLCIGTRRMRVLMGMLMCVRARGSLERGRVFRCHSRLGYVSRNSRVNPDVAQATFMQAAVCRCTPWYACEGLRHRR